MPIKIAVKIASLNKIIAGFFVCLIRFYQILISPLLGNYKCRFSPSCSQYMIEAINKKGLLKGVALGVLRLCKCHPFSKKSGFDPLK
jgi:putative membrane protein insertion efficiency factor